MVREDAYQIPGMLQNAQNLMERDFEDAVKPAYQLREEARQIDLHTNEVFTGEDIKFLSDEAESFAQSTHAEIQPRPDTQESRVYSPQEILQATRNLTLNLRPAYMAAAEQGRHSLGLQQDYTRGV